MLYLTRVFVFSLTDTDYISQEEKQKVELMLTFLTEESKQAAASSAVSITSCLMFYRNHFDMDMMSNVSNVSHTHRPHLITLVLLHAVDLQITVHP